MWKATLTLDYDNPNGTISESYGTREGAIQKALDTFDRYASWDRAGESMAYPFNEHWVQIDDHEARELIECERID
jgi:hypothetical protein